jgi:hypothetical protein
MLDMYELNEDKEMDVASIDKLVENLFEQPLVA